MPRITPGNRLYLYQLFVREIGVGKQTMLTRVEDVLAADDIQPSDLECASVREMLEALDEFVRLSVFKKGRVYATILAKPEWDQLLAAAADDGTKGEKATTQKGGPKSWKKKRSNKSPRPAKPRPKGRPKPETVEEPAVEETATELEPVAEPIPAPESQPELLAAQEAATRSEPGPASEPQATPEPEPAADPRLDPEAAPEPEAEPTPEPEPAPEPEPIHTSTITLKVTYDPYEGIEEDVAVAEPEQPETEPVPEPEPKPPIAPEPIPEPEPAPVPKPIERPVRLLPQDILPHHFAAEVVCKNTMLSALYQILPFDVDPIALLDEDWAVARSTEAYEVEGGSVVFPLRYLCKKDGDPLKVRMRRKPRSVSGKRWELVGIGDAGTSLDQIGFDGLPTEDDGAWSDLVAGASVSTDFVTPARLLAQFAHLGPWNQLLSTLAELAAPEPWGQDHAVLREYLTLTFYRVMQQDLLVTADDLTWAAFDTGLLTSEGQSIYMRFRAGDKSNPWELQSFGTEVPQPIPQPATYIEELDDIAFAPPFTVRTSTILARTYANDLQPAIDRALRHARRSYRIATPAYDPRADRLRLLLPVQLESGEPQALVLARQPQGGYLATAIIGLDRARACARVVSTEPPSWLA